MCFFPHCSVVCRTQAHVLRTQVDYKGFTNYVNCSACVDYLDSMLVIEDIKRWRSLDFNMTYYGRGISSGHSFHSSILIIIFVAAGGINIICKGNKTYLAQILLAKHYRWLALVLPWQRTCGLYQGDIYMCLENDPRIEQRAI